MPKLQRIKRSNGSVVYSVNIPLEIIEELEWVKGLSLTTEIQEIKGSPVIMVFKQEDGSTKKEEEKNDAEI